LIVKFNINAGCYEERLKTSITNGEQPVDLWYIYRAELTENIQT